MVDRFLIGSQQVFTSFFCPTCVCPNLYDCGYSLCPNITAVSGKHPTIDLYKVLSNYF